MPTLVSIIIDNYNYAHFLPRAIDSALAQNYPCEVIVVDDASTDNSAEIIRSYGAQITPVLRPRNGGHAAAFNSGFAVSHGHVILFLDADDYLYTHAVARAVAAFGTDGKVAKVQWRLDLVDREGRVLDSYPAPEIKFDSGDVVWLLLNQGRYETPVTAGNAFNREALLAVMPIPEDAFRQGAEGYLVSVVPFYGLVVSIEDRLGAYVQHGANFITGGGIARRLRWAIEHDFARHLVLGVAAAQRGWRLHRHVERRDALHLANRIASLALAPEQHPVATDWRPELGLWGAWAARRLRLPWRRRLLLALWFLCVGTLPRRGAAAVAAWRFDPTARPTAVRHVLGRLRTLTR